MRIRRHRVLNKPRCTFQVTSLEELVSHLQEVTSFFPLFLSYCVVEIRHGAMKNFDSAEKLRKTSGRNLCLLVA
jgi:hypothetical protein